MKRTQPIEDPKRTLPLLWAAIVVAGLPFVFHLPSDAIGFSLLACTWRIAVLYGKARMPGRPALFLLTAAGSALVYFHFHRFHGVEAAGSLLLTGIGLKFLEMSTRRDFYLVTYLGFLSAVTAYLLEQGIVMAVYTLGVVILLIACLFTVNGAGSLPLGVRLRMSAVLVLQAVPLMLVLFLFVPRIAGPLWHLPQSEPAAGSGLSDTMEPGAISRLALSHGTAFRVDFQGAVPPPNERYWRGPVFWFFDGRRWTEGREPSQSSRLPSQAEGTPYSYVLTLEPHQRRWVFPLEFADAVPGDLQRHEDGYLLARQPLLERKRYEIRSRSEVAWIEISEAARRRALQLPAEPSRRVRRLAMEWRSDHAEAEAVVQQALQYFREQPFVYTLQPPAIAGDPVEGFLFGSRRGFCEHYAGAFVYLMRAAGIPARVVTGYQGGHWNPVGRFLEVEQADAHAWAEVWLNGRGWTRVDPTAAVAPERIEREAVFADRPGTDGAVMFEGPVAEALLERLRSLRGWITEAGLLWDSVDHAWHRWVLAYDSENQRRFFERLGVMDWQGVSYWLAGILGALMLGSSFALLQRGPAADPTLKIYRRVARYLEKAGIVRHPAEGWHDFAHRVAALRPDLAESFGHFTELFVTIRYRGNGDGRALSRLDRLARQFPDR